MNNSALIIKKIKESVKPAMDKWVDDMEKYLVFLERYCVHQVYDDPEYKANRSAYKLEELKRRVGYTTACYRFFHRTPDDKRQMIEKEAKNKLSKIDIAVAKKLKGINIETAENLYFSTTSADSYCEGAWKINGDKIFSFRTIYAGGWNIQIEHVRTLYTYK